MYTGRALVWACRHGLSPTVNCNRSAIAASSSLAPNATLSPGSASTLIPAPATPGQHPHRGASQPRRQQLGAGQLLRLFHTLAANRSTTHSEVRATHRRDGLRWFADLDLRRRLAGSGSGADLSDDVRKELTMPVLPNQAAASSIGAWCFLVQYRSGGPATGLFASRTSSW